MKKRLLCLALALILVLTATPALASQGDFDGVELHVFPGDSTPTAAAVVRGKDPQRLVLDAHKDEPNSMDVHIEN